MSQIDELERLAALKEKGVLSEQEFSAQKAKILSAKSRGSAQSDRVIQKKSGMSWLSMSFITIAALFVLFIAYGAAVGSSPEAKERSQERRVIEQCWKDQERKSLTPAAARIMAEMCESMESNFRMKHGREP